MNLAVNILLQLVVTLKLALSIGHPLICRSLPRLGRLGGLLLRVVGLVPAARRAAPPAFGGRLRLLGSPGE